MRLLFPGFYEPSDDELDRLWHACTFAFDASALLMLYRYSEPTRQTFMESLRRLSNRIWLPHHAALEYQRGRVAAIHKELKAYDDVHEKLQPIHDQLLTRWKHPFLQPATVKRFGRLFKTIETELKAGKEAQVLLMTRDPVQDKLADLFEQRVSLPYGKERLAEVEKEAKDRFPKKIPPGYIDQGKSPANRYGDLIIWQQLLDKAAEHKEGLIFVTEDLKEDWWQKPTKRPRPELRQEMYDTAKSAFYMYRLRAFLDRAARMEGKALDDNVVRELTSVEQQRTDEPVKQHVAINYDVLMERYADATLLFQNFLDLAATAFEWCDNRKADPSDDAPLLPPIKVIGKHADELLAKWSKDLPPAFRRRLRTIADQCAMTATLPAHKQIRKADYLKPALKSFVEDLADYLGVQEAN